MATPTEGSANREDVRYIGQKDVVAQQIGPLEQQVYTVAQKAIQKALYYSDAEVPNPELLTTGHWRKQFEMAKMRSLQGEYPRLERVWSYPSLPETCRRTLHISDEHVLINYTNAHTHDEVIMQWLHPQQYTFGRFLFEYHNNRQSATDDAKTRGTIQLFYDEYPTGYQHIATLDGNPFFESDKDPGAYFDQQVLGGSYTHAGKPVSSLRF